MEAQVSQATVIPALCGEQYPDQLWTRNDNQVPHYEANSSINSNNIDTGHVFILTAKTDLPFARFDRAAEAVLVVNWHDSDSADDNPGFSYCVGKCLLDTRSLSLGMYLPGQISQNNDVYERIEVGMNAVFLLGYIT